MSFDQTKHKPRSATTITPNQNQFKSNFEKAFELIIPLKTAEEAARILRPDEELSIFIDPNQIQFNCGEQEIISRLVEGKFPDYEAVIPRNVLTEITNEKGELVNGLKLAGVFAGKVNDIKLKAGEGKKFLEIYSADSAIGENRYLIPVKISGPAANIAFNWRYLMDGIKPFLNEEIVLGVNSFDKPAIIKNREDKSFFYVIMPVKV